MKIKVGINGFGRIGRTILRQVLLGQPDIEVVIVNDIAELPLCAHLFAYDSVFGLFPGEVGTDGNDLIVDGRRIRFSCDQDLSQTDLNDIDVWLECAGHAKTREIAARGLQAGAGKVLISGPSEAAEVTVVMGANDADLADQTIISNASCTTNALAPLMRALDDAYRVNAAHMTTIHCYTASQPMSDAPRGDFARSRAGALSMVPTTTSATRWVRHVLPHLADRLTGAAVRVPVASVSAVDVVATLEADITANVVNEMLASVVPGIVGVTHLPLVSSDLRARPESLIVATPETMCPGPRQVRVFGWYDNEWGFSARMIDMVRRIAST